ncbi:type VI secretion system lipoprotein TssJ [Affinibrenneria salicis]|uniref:Type VI secretion system lipoprotein TssJ n=1 Tax=Affinibrenneria salicis TaxID=2590031 RepID=A0A5J5FXE6_9GAMM|nr:type VI secretion system lipoprotein TssJ [Affinibrenneria salicis]KAA8998153.1 type VI secretion system lipoprotein TssJ [Affinibrenneria salicis]
MKFITTLRQFRLALLLAAVTLLAGCMSSSRSVPSDYSLRFIAHPEINEAAPLKIRVMVLKSDADFMAADFYSLQNNAQGVLGSNLISVDQFFLMPGQLDKNVAGQGSQDARYIGIMAEYRVLDGKKWRISLPLPAPTDTNFYKVWQYSPDKLKARIIADINGIRAVSE